MDAVETLLPGAAEADHALLTGEDPTPEIPAVAEVEATPPAPSESGQARDDKGRFSSQAPETPAPSPVEAEADPDVPVEEPLPESAPTPFSYAADGADHEIPGAVVDGEYLKIPVEQLPAITRLLSEGHAWNGSAQRYFAEANQRHQQIERRALDAETRAGAAEAQAKQILGHFEQLVEGSRGYSPDQILQSPMGQYLMDLVGNWSVLKAQSEAAALRMQLEQRTKAAETRESTEREAQLRPQIESAIGQWVQHHGTAAGLSREVMQRLYEDLKDPAYEKILIVKAEADDIANGVRKGELAINHGFIEKEVKRIQGFAPKASPAPVNRPAPPKPQAPTARPKVPPTVSATKGPAPQKAKWVPKSQQEADDALLHGGFDDE
jgi:hypothetical protein